MRETELPARLNKGKPKDSFSLLHSYTYPTNSLYSSRRKRRKQDSFSWTYRSHSFGPLPTLLTHSAEPLFPDLQRQGKAFLLHSITSASLLSVLAFLSSFLCFMPFLLSLKDSVNGIGVFIFCPIPCRFHCIAPLPLGRAVERVRLVTSGSPLSLLSLKVKLLRLFAS